MCSRSFAEKHDIDYGRKIEHRKHGRTVPSTMLEINEVRLYGELSDEPRSGTTPGDGQSWASIRLLTLHSYVGKDKQRVVRKDWVTVKLWGKQADYVVLYLGLGSQVYLEGHLRNERWVDPATQEKRYSLVIVADHIQALNVGDDEEGDGKRDRDGGEDLATHGAGTVETVPAVQPGVVPGQQPATDEAGEELDAGSPEFEELHGLQPPPWPKAQR